MSRRVQFNLGNFELMTAEAGVEREYKLQDSVAPQEAREELSVILDELLATDYQRAYDLTANQDSIITTETFEPFIKKEETVNA